MLCLADFIDYTRGCETWDNWKRLTWETEIARKTILAINASSSLFDFLIEQSIGIHIPDILIEQITRYLNCCSLFSWWEWVHRQERKLHLRIPSQSKAQEMLLLGCGWDELTLLSLRSALALRLMKAGTAQWWLLARVLVNSILHSGWLLNPKCWIFSASQPRGFSNNDWMTLTCRPKSIIIFTLNLVTKEWPKVTCSLWID